MFHPLCKCIIDNYARLLCSCLQVSYFIYFYFILLNSLSEDEESSNQTNQKDYSVMKKHIQRLQSDNGLFL